MAALGLTIFGIGGRMGQSVLRALGEVPDLALVGAVASPGSTHLGEDAALAGGGSGVVITADAAAGLAGAAVAIDFSVAASVAEHARACASARVPLLVGATGLDAAARAVLEQAGREVAVLIAPNTSVGVGVMAKLVAIAASTLSAAYDVEISEAHHRLKRDAPSGTALALGEVVAAARGATLDALAVYDRHGAAATRAAGSIGFSVVRAGDIVGEHTVTFAAPGERIEITHRATDRMIFARGAVTAATWLAGQTPGLYGMQDVLSS